ncbi:M1 family peptidase [candidate division KSB1 bacterium]|nr:MAG: M1 family peptidase [candidate division KSB1 bacterium]
MNRAIRLILAFIGTFVWAWAIPLHAQEDLSPLLTPRQFHDMECARLRSAFIRMQSARPLDSEQSDYDAVYYHLTLDVRDFTGRIIYGTSTITARSLDDNLDELILDLCSTFTVDSVICNGLRTFSLTDGLLTIALDRAYAQGELVQVSVTYHGTPCQNNEFPSFSYLNRSWYGRRYPTIFTLSEPFGASDWWPCKNDPSDKADSVRVSIIVADTLTATSNGILESVAALPASSKMFTWVERYPIATYLVCLNASNYAHYTNWYIALNGDSVPIEHYPYPEKLTQAQTSWNALPAMMTFNAQKFGEYPFVTEKYGHTMWTIPGSAAMEHQCNTSFDFAWTDGGHSYDFLVQHELAHQWWGDDVTLATWPDIWLNEGFASYSEALWFEHINGFAAYRNYMFSSAGLRVIDPSGPVYNPGELFDGNTVYNKGGWILHILRGAIRNDSLFFAGLREYRSRHALGNATTAECLADMSDVAGYDVTPYVYAYLYLTNRPQYRVSFDSGELHGQWQTVVRIRQTQTNPDTTFTTRLDLRLTANSDTFRTRVENSTRNERYYLRPDFQPTQLAVDPDDWVLKQITTESLPLTILNNSLADAVEAVPYTDTLYAIGGYGGMRFWSYLGNESGLALSTDGVLSGIPEDGGDFLIIIVVEDDLAGADTVEFVLHIQGILHPPQRLSACLHPENGLLELRWSSVPEADYYRINRSPFVDMHEIDLTFTTTDTIASDTLILGSVTGDSSVKRFYSVTSGQNP